MSPDIAASREQYGRVSAWYDRSPARLLPTRRMAVDRLQLRRGDVVLDVGCGTGLCFPLIEDRVGPEGKIIGVEPSPEMLEQAKSRVESNGWRNVTLIEATAEDAEPPEAADAVLFHYTHDILRSPPALENIFRHAKPGTRVAAAGAKWTRWWRPAVNAYVWAVTRRTVTTFEGFARPWDHLGAYLSDIRVRPLMLGTAYLAWGRYAGRAASEDAMEAGS